MGKDKLLTVMLLSRMTKYLTIVLYVGFVLAAVIYKDELQAWLHEGSRPPVTLMLAAAVAAAMLPVPVIPYGIVSGLLAAMYGLAAGIVLGWAGSTLAAMLMLIIFRVMGAGKGRAMLAKYRGLETFLSWTERNPFTAILLSRMIPVIPAQAVNLYAAVARIPFATFAIATGIGKIPLMALYAIAGFELLGETA